MIRPAQAIPSRRPSRWHSPPAPQWPKPPSLPTSPRGLSCGASAAPPTRPRSWQRRSPRWWTPDMGTLHALEALAREVARRQATGERAVFTNGVFDLLHFGHLHYLQSARELGDFLIVGLNSDESVCRIKGPKRPLVPEFERAALVAGL